MALQIGQMEIDAFCASAGAILGHLTAGGNRSVQATAVNIFAGAPTGFFLGPVVVDHWDVAPGRPAGGVVFVIATIGALVVPTILRGLRPWAEKNTSNMIGRAMNRLANILAPAAANMGSSDKSAAEIVIPAIVVAEKPKSLPPASEVSK